MLGPHTLLLSSCEKSVLSLSEGKSADSFCQQEAAMVTAMFFNFYVVKNHKIADNSATPKARENNKHIFGILRILEIF
jgi:hypothetical protein